MSDIQQISITMQRLVDLISVVTHKCNNTGAVTTVDNLTLTSQNSNDKSDKDVLGY
jgi:hypothetical protein